MYVGVFRGKKWGSVKSKKITKSNFPNFTADDKLQVLTINTATQLITFNPPKKPGLSHKNSKSLMT